MDERAAAHGSDLAAREEAGQRERAERTRQLVDLDIVLAVQSGAAAEARHHQAARVHASRADALRSSEALECIFMFCKDIAIS